MSENHIRTDGNLAIDLSHEKDGYFFARVIEPDDKKYRLRVGLTYYKLAGDGSWETFPFSDGSKLYSIRLYRLIKGIIYSRCANLNIEAKLDREDGAFIVPNKMVDYNAGTPAVQLSLTLCEGSSKADSIKIIQKWIKDNIRYDYVREVKLKKGNEDILPDIDYCFNERMGICQDIAALAVCMMRVVGIPARLIFGYADRNYHAWVEYELDGGKRKCYDPTWIVKGSSKSMKPKKYISERSY